MSDADAKRIKIRSRDELTEAQRAAAEAGDDSDDGELEEPFVVRIAALGDANVGKTALLRRFDTGQFRAERRETAGVDYLAMDLLINHPKYNQQASVQVHDTAGQERYAGVTKAFLRHKDGVFIVFDATDFSTFSSMRKWRDLVAECSPEAVCAMVANKVDLYDVKTDQGTQRYTQWMDNMNFESKAAEFQCEVGFFQCSAKDGTNVDHALVTLIEQAAKRKRDINDRLMRADTGRKTTVTLQARQKQQPGGMKCCAK